MARFIYGHRALNTEIFFVVVFTFQTFEYSAALQYQRSILLVLTHMYFSVSYLILTVDEKAVMTGRV